MTRSGSTAFRTAALLAAVTCLAVAGCGGGHDSPAAPQRSTKTVTVAAGSGAGRVTSADGKLDCRVANGATGGPVCAAVFDSGAVVTVSAVADPDHEFMAWAGDCEGATCQLLVTRDHTTAPAFTPAVRALSLELTTPNSDDGALIIEVSGPNIVDIKPLSGLQAIETRVSHGAVTTATLLFHGVISSGPIAHMTVRGVGTGTPYSVRVLQAAARASGSYAQRLDLGPYRVTVQR